MRRKGNLPGGVLSDVQNEISKRWYLISTAPEIERFYWSTVVFPAEERSFFLGLFRRRIPNLNKKIFSIIRNTEDEALEAHEEVEELVTDESEESWLSKIPSPIPPEGVNTKRRE